MSSSALPWGTTLKFGHHRSIMKGTLHEEQRTFSPISLVPFMCFYLKPISFVQPSWLHFRPFVTFVTIDLKWRALYVLGSNTSYIKRVFLQLHIQQWARIAYKTLLVCDRSVMKVTLLDHIPSWLYLFFNSRDFPETTYTALSTQGLQNL